MEITRILHTFTQINPTMKKVLTIAVCAVVAAAVIALAALQRKSKVAMIIDDELNEDIRSALGTEVDCFKTSGGRELAIFSIKHASLAIRAGGKWIYADPVTDGVKPETDYSELPEADIILVTHDHFDHLDTMAIAQLSGENTTVIGNGAAIAETGFGKAMENGDCIETADGIKIEAVPAYNNTPGKLQFHPKGRDNGYVLTVDGLRIYIAGDTEVIPELADIKDIDIAFLPCNLPYTMTPEQCAEAARTIKPAVLFPYHYSDTDIDRLPQLLEGSGIDVRIRSYR